MEKVRKEDKFHGEIYMLGDLEYEDLLVNFIV